MFEPQARQQTFSHKTSTIIERARQSAQETRTAGTTKRGLKKARSRVHVAMNLVQSRQWALMLTVAFFDADHCWQQSIHTELHLALKIFI